MILVVLLGALAGPARADELAIPGLDARDLSGDALVWEDAAFYLEPWQGGHKVRLQTFGRKRADEAGRVIPVRIVSSTLRRFVEIEFAEHAACTFRTVEVDSRVEALRVFVKREDLAPVLVKPYAASYSDGTSVRLATGAPVMPTPSGRYIVAARGDELRLPIPHGSVGWVYSADRVEDPAPPAGKLFRLDRYHATATLDGEPFRVQAPWLAAKPAKHGETVHLRWSTRCIELVVAVPAARLRPVPRPGLRLFGGGGSGTASGPSHFIPLGAPLFTPSGYAAGVAGEVIDVWTRTGDSFCFDARLAMTKHDSDPASRAWQSFKLCAPARVVKRDPEAPAVAQDPTATPPDVARPPAGAKRTAAGVWYRVLRAGKGGPKPTATSRVTVHYAGWTTDGQLFDSSYTRQQPAEFPLQGVIAGWTDGLQVMSAGDKVRFWIPEELAYKGSARRPSGMLVFDVELLAFR